MRLILCVCVCVHVVVASKRNSEAALCLGFRCTARAANLLYLQTPDPQPHIAIHRPETFCKSQTLMPKPYQDTRAGVSS